MNPSRTGEVGVLWEVRYSISSVKSPVSQMDDVVLSMITKFF